jgi:hypothetical protein
VAGTVDGHEVRGMSSPRQSRPARAGRGRCSACRARGVTAIAKPTTATTAMSRQIRARRTAFSATDGPADRDLA